MNDSSSCKRCGLVYRLSYQEHAPDELIGPSARSSPDAVTSADQWRSRSPIIGRRRILLPHEILSVREREVLLLIASACFIKIADKLALSVPSAPTARDSQKMGCTNADLIRYVLHHGLGS
jgi:DNA-binding CsgD family transcriptional regulator